LVAIEGLTESYEKLSKLLFIFPFVYCAADTIKEYININPYKYHQIINPL